MAKSTKKDLIASITNLGKAKKAMRRISEETSEYPPIQEKGEKRMSLSGAISTLSGFAKSLTDSK